jgi:hypothetical protein
MSKPSERWVSKWDRRTAVATDDYLWGVQNPARGPATAAIAARATLEAKMASKETWNKWEDGLKFVGDEGIKAAAAAKGPARYTSGITYGRPKFEDFAAKFKSHLDSQLPAIQAMSTATLEQAAAKAVAMMKANAKFRYKKK